MPVNFISAAFNETLHEPTQNTFSYFENFYYILFLEKRYDSAKMKIPELLLHIIYKIYFRLRAVVENTH